VLDELSNAIALCKHISALHYVLVIFQLARRSSEARCYFIIELKHVQRERERERERERVRGWTRWKSFRMKTSPQLFATNSRCHTRVSCFARTAFAFSIKLFCDKRRYRQLNNVTGREIRVFRKLD